MSEQVLVVGAGIVGVCCGLALTEAGFATTLIDRADPGGAASRWNAGVFATSSLIPLNSPGLLAQLPRLLTGRSPSFRLSPRAIPEALRWGAAFIKGAHAPQFGETVRGLDALIRLSHLEHRRLLADANAQALVHEAGWLFLYETAANFDAGAPMRRVMTAHGVAHQPLHAAELAAMEPHLSPRFARAVFFPDSAAAIEPGAVLCAYLKRFLELGGQVRRGEVAALEAGPAVVLRDGTRLRADHVGLAAGPWSARLLRTLGLRLPMMSERGYVQRFSLAPGAVLHRPVYDTAGGIVASPRPEGVQISTGSELTLPGLPDLDRQRGPAARRAAELLPLGRALEQFEATADRPSLPDSRPAIGRLADIGRIWLCCGHQHIGFSTSAGSARLLAALMRDAAPPIDPAPFAPSRFGI